MAVHRFKAGESKEQDNAPTKRPVKKVSAVTAETPKKLREKATQPATDGARRRNVFVRIGQYFKGSWFELRQVRWPNRKQTWQLTLAVIAFSLLLGGLIFGLDALFTWLFKEVIL